MDSPSEPIKPTTSSAAAATTATSDSPSVQESPFSNYVSNLSPIKSVKTSRVAQGFSGINSPLVFTSPHLVVHCPSFVQRSYCSHETRVEVGENDSQSKKLDDGPCGLEKSACTPKASGSKNPEQDQPSSSSGCVEEYLSDPVEVDCANYMNFGNLQGEQSNNVLLASVTNLKETLSEADQILDIGTSREATQILFEQPEEESQGQSTLSIVAVIEEEKKNGGKQPSSERPTAEADSFIDHASYEEQSETPGSQASHLQRGMSRRCLQFGEAIPPPYGVRSPLSVSKPSGIGLHLNSIANALPLGHKVTATIKAASSLSCQIVENKSSSPKSQNFVENVWLVSEDQTLENKESLAAMSAISKSFLNADSSETLQPIEVTPLNKRKLKSEFTDGIAEFNQSIRKKKRKKPSSDDDGCKRCNCKKTKCLKLYCDCFAAGIYCADPCSCQGCFNRPEYEDTVLETRRQIESRNPFAFAPKIVEDVTEFPAIIGDDQSLLATSAARHKRGCNCKKSKCLKKYCECYQANVGCSSECRCDGCKNVHGRREERGLTEETLCKGASEKTLEGAFDNTLEIGTSSEGFELHDQHNIIPLTPSFQCSNHGKDAPKSRLGRFVCSPGADLSVFSSYTRSSRGPVNAHSNDTIQERNKGIDLYSPGKQMDYDVVQMMNQFSPVGVSDFSPLQNPSSLTAMSSASSKTRSWIQLRPGSGLLLPSGSLRWRSSPITPMVQSGGIKIQELDSDIKLHNVVLDDTPEILKEESTPSTSVKVSSPNKKRVSPPHGGLRELGPTSSGGLKSGLKFILKSVPSFPPLTPCMHSKDGINQ